MSVDDVVDGTADDSRKQPKYHFDRHTPEYRLQFQKITEEMHEKCPMAWTETYNGHWVAAGSHRRRRGTPTRRTDGRTVAGSTIRLIRPLARALSVD